MHLPHGQAVYPSRRLSCGLPGDPGSRSADCADPRRQRDCQSARLLLGGPDYSGEKILTADLDPGEVAEGKFDLDVAGHFPFLEFLFGFRFACEKKDAFAFR
jgi:hypothetical protein